MLIIHGFIGILIVMLILFFGWCCGILFCYYVPWEKATPRTTKQPRKQAMPVVATTDKPQIAHPVVTQLEMPCEMIQR